MMSRRTSSRSITFKEKDDLQADGEIQLDQDIEKLLDSPQKKSSRLNFFIILAVCAISLVATVGLLCNLSSNASNLRENFNLEQDQFFSKILDADISSKSPVGGSSSSNYDGPDVETERSRGLFAKVVDLLSGKKGQQSYAGNDALLIDNKGIDFELSHLGSSARPVDNDSGKSKSKVSTVKDDEDVKIFIKRPQAEKSGARQAVGGSGAISLLSETASKNIQMAIKEILSVSTMAILLNNDPNSSSKSSKEKENMVVNIIKSLNITPQPTMVNLIKHPKYNQIIEYLKTYQYHKFDDDEEIDSDEIVEVTIENIPSVFVGGLPIANYDEIIEMYDRKQLVGYLRTIGKGLISVD